MSSREPTEEELEQLMKAARDGDITTLKYLIKDQRIDINIHGPRHFPWRGRTPLLVSAVYGQSTAVDHLLEWKANIHAVDEDGHTALHLAAVAGYTSVIEQCIKAGLNVNAVDDDKWSPLHCASFNGHVAVVDLLLRNGAAINQTDDVGRTPLDYAVKCDYSAVVWTLINSHKADFSHCDEDTKQKISELLAIEEEKRKTQQDPSSSSKVNTDDSVDTTQADLSHEAVNKIFMDSTLPSPDVRVAMMGTEGSGKTCLGDTLTGQEFRKDTQPTEGADEMEVVVKSAVDWNIMTKEEVIDNLQQQVLQEVDHSATKPASKESTTLPAKSTSVASVGQSCLSKAKPGKPPTPSLPMLQLPGGDKMYILTIEEFKQLPSILEKYDPLRRYVNIWDSAGQQVFQHTHGLFVSEEVVCLIVFDASKLLEDVPERRYESDKSPARSGLGTITYWMDLISCRVSKKSTSDSDLSEFLPTFILVGTKIDLLSSDINEAEKIASQKLLPILKEKIAGKPFAKHIAGSKNGRLFTPGSPSIFFLSNDVRNLKVVAELQGVILRGAPVKGRPTRLVMMERKLMLLSHEEKLSVVDMEQVKEVARSCGISTNGKDVLEVLKFFHQKRTLLYFHQIPALSNVIILSPQWLAKLLTYILTNLLCQPAGPPLAQYAKERSSEGLLRQELLKFCIQQFLADEVNKGRKIPELICSSVVDLLLKFKLMVDVSDTSLAAKKRIDSREKVFLVPHLLPVQPFVPATDPCYKVFYHFPSQFLPDSLVDQLIVKCAEWNQEYNFGFLKLAYQWIIMELGNFHFYLLRPVHEDNLIELTIVSDCTSTHEKELVTLSNELIFDVKTFIDDLMQEIMTSAVKEFPVKCYLPCPRQCSVLHVTMEKVVEKSSDFCPNTGQRIDMTKYHKMLTSRKCSTGKPMTISNVKESTSYGEVVIQTDKYCSTACAKLQNQYDKLIHLPVKGLIPSLYAKEVIDSNQKKIVDATLLDADKMGYVLDLITDSLKAGVAVKYNNFLKVLKDSKDSVANVAVKSLAPPILITNELPQDITAQEDNNTSRRGTPQPAITKHISSTKKLRLNDD